MSNPKNLSIGVLGFWKLISCPKSSIFFSWMTIQINKIALIQSFGITKKHFSNRAWFVFANHDVKCLKSFMCCMKQCREKNHSNLMITWKIFPLIPMFYTIHPKVLGHVLTHLMHCKISKYLLKFIHVHILILGPKLHNFSTL